MSKENIRKGQINESIPNVTKQAQKENSKESNAHTKSVKDKVDSVYGTKGKSEVKPNKYEMTDDEKTRHNELAILNGMEMIEYTHEPSEKFKERAEAGILGSSKTGNETHLGEWNPETGEGSGNTEPTWEASKESFSKDLVNRIKSSKKKRDDARLKYVALGQDIELTDKPNASTKLAFVNETDNMNKSQLNEESFLGKGYTHVVVDKNTNKIMLASNYDEFKEDGKYDMQSVKDHVKEDLADTYPDELFKLKDIAIMPISKAQKMGIDFDTKNSYWNSVYKNKYKEDSDNIELTETTHYAVVDNKIVKGFDFSGKSKSEIVESVDTLVYEPIKEVLGESFDSKGVKLYTSRGLTRLGLNESVEENWFGKEPLFEGTHILIHKPTQTIVESFDFGRVLNESESKNIIKETIIKNLADKGITEHIKLSDIKVLTLESAIKSGVNIAKSNAFVFETKEKMKSLMFKKSFGGFKQAERLIPESFKKDMNLFEMTDGNETYLIRWEGTINEGVAIKLKEENKEQLNETMNRMKHVLCYNSLDTLGTRDSINESKLFESQMDAMRAKTKTSKEIIKESVEQVNKEIKPKFNVNQLEQDTLTEGLVKVIKAKYITEGNSYEGVQYFVEIEDSVYGNDVIKNRVVSLNEHNKPSDRSINFIFQDKQGNIIG